MADPRQQQQQQQQTPTRVTVQGLASNLVQQYDQLEEYARRVDGLASQPVDPVSIPVPDDSGINALITIGAALRGMGGDPRALEDVLQRKQRFADMQRAVVAENINAKAQAEQATVQRQLAGLSTMLDVHAQQRQIATTMHDIVPFEKIDEGNANEWLFGLVNTGGIPDVGTGLQSAKVQKALEALGYTPDQFPEVLQGYFDQAELDFRRRRILAGRTKTAKELAEENQMLKPQDWLAEYGGQFETILGNASAGKITGPDGKLRDATAEELRRELRGAQLRLQALDGSSSYGTNVMEHYQRMLDEATEKGYGNLSDPLVEDWKAFHNSSDDATTIQDTWNRNQPGITEHPNRLGRNGDSVGERFGSPDPLTVDRVQEAPNPGIGGAISRFFGGAAETLGEAVVGAEGTRGEGKPLTEYAGEFRQDLDDAAFTAIYGTEPAEWNPMATSEFQHEQIEARKARIREQGGAGRPDITEAERRTLRFLGSQ
jgi:hypothetical protein